MGKFSALERCQLTKSWTLEEKAGLGHFLKEKILARGEKLFLETSHRALGIVEAGTVEFLTKDSKKSVVINPGESFGDFSLVSKNPKVLQAKAAENLVYWELSAEDWQDLRKSAPSVALRLLESIVSKAAKLASEIVNQRV
jgi:CRP-like cAMP-binding protein